MLTSNSSCYSPDTVLRLSVLGTGPRSPLFLRHLDSLKVQVINVIEPVTLSVVVHVKLLLDEEVTVPTPRFSPTAILKLYDRRFLAGLPENSYLYKNTPSWTSTTDQELFEFLRTHGIEKFGSTYDKDDEFFDGSWTAIEKEAFLYTRCLRFYNCETKAYDTLETLQGIDIPALYANVQLQAELDTQSIPVNGLLLETIEGFSLRDLMINAPEDSWQAICEEAIAIVNKIDDCNVINEDVRIDNVLVRKSNPDRMDGNGTAYKVIFIDFALAWVRDSLKDKPTDQEWTTWKCGIDEEGALGYVIQEKLKRRVGSKKKKVDVFGFKYTPSQRYIHSGADLYKGPLGSFSATTDGSPSD